MIYPSDNRKAGVLIKTSLVDFPGHVACAVFLHGCNLRCPYCYNTELVTGSPEDVQGAVTLGDITAHLEKRKAVLTGLVVSGGEPLLSPFTVPLIRTAKELGYLIKLDTNGMNSEKLRQFLEDDALRPDFIAMDLKTSLDRLHLLAPHIKNPADMERMKESLKESISLIAGFPAENREFRTVLVPPLVDEHNINDMAQLLPKDAAWKFAGFRNENCVDPLYSSIMPYTQKEEESIITAAASIIPQAVLR